MLFAAAALVLQGCARDEAPTTSYTPEPWGKSEVARVGGTVITQAMLEEAMRRPGDPRSKTAALEELIRFHAVANRARADGLERDPEVRRAMDEMLVARYRERGLERRLEVLPAITDADITAHYERNLGRFTTPAMARAAVIQLKASPKAAPDQRIAIRSRAESVLGEARTADEARLRILASQYSEDQATRYVGGDTGWLTAGDALSRWDTAVIDAVFSLEAPGDTAPLVEADAGYFIVKLIERKPAWTRPLAEVRDGIIYQLERRRREQAQHALEKETRDSEAVEINAALLDRIPDSTNDVAATPPRGPGDKLH